MSSQPFMEVFLQTAVDPVLAPPGCHVASAFTQYAPTSGTVAHGEALDTVGRPLGAFAPNAPSAVLGAHAPGPLDLERPFGLTHAPTFHGASRGARVRPGFPDGCAPRRAGDPDQPRPHRDGAGPRTGRQGLGDRRRGGGGTAALPAPDRHHRVPGYGRLPGRPVVRVRSDR